MQNWEYLVLYRSGIQHVFHTTATPDRQPYQPGGDQHNIAEILSSFGAEGWELVSVNKDHDRDAIYYFKRPLGEAN